MNHLLRPLVACATALAIAALAGAQGAFPSSTYTLQGDAGYTMGCYPPCLCPLWFTSDLNGTFELTFIGRNALGDEFYDVTEVDWTLPNTSGSMQAVTGSGSYTITNGVLQTQRLELDLSFDGAAPIFFWSGDVPFTEPFPILAITISRNGMVCFDQVFDIVAGPEVGTNFCIALPNSTGQPGSIGSSGTASVARNDLVLVAESLPAGQFGLFYYGPDEVQVPLGNGIRCIGGPVFRLLPPTLSSGQGVLTHALDVTDPPAVSGTITAGSTWKFQSWFRDTAAGGAGFNLTDGLSVLFLP